MECRYQAQWTCPCGVGGLLEQTHWFCPACGAAARPARFPDWDHLVAVDEHPFHGGAHRCCERGWSAKAAHCGGCGTSLARSATRVSGGLRAFVEAVRAQREGTRTAS